MKLKWIACALALMALFCAHGEEAKYLSAEDTLYWHENSACAGVFCMESDDTAGYFACPVCVQEELEPKVTAVERGGTIILKLPDSWARSRKDIGGVFAGTSTDYYEGEEAREQLKKELHGREYAEFMKTWEETGSAKAWRWIPGIYPRNDELFMNERYIGGAWYVTMRPDKVSGDSKKIYLRFFAGAIEADGDRLGVDGDQEWGKTDYSLKFSKKKSKSSAFSKDYGDFKISLYKELGIHIAVIRQKNADKDLLNDVRLTIGDQPDVILTGYMDGTDGVFCCTLTDGEAHLLESGADVRLWHENWYSEDDFHGTPYAVARKDTGGYGVIDREGNFILGPGYAQADRYNNTVFLKEEDRDVVVINLDTMATLGTFDCPKGKYITTRPINSSVFAIEISDIWYLYETETGFPLAVLPIDEPDSPSYSHVMGGIDGDYPLLQNGYPRRLVFYRPVDAYEHYCWLADNHGNRITDNYQHIEPLIWDEDRGLFAVSIYNPSELEGHPNNREKYAEGYDGREFFGPSWRIGLIDEKGNTVAPVEYVYIKAGANNTIELRREDGSVEFVAW